MRHYLTAYDASLLSSHLYSVLNKDPCVNMLGKFELNVKVHVSRSPGSNNVEIDVLSGGVGKMATAKKREKSEKVIVPSPPKTRPSKSWDVIKKNLGAASLRSKPRPPSKPKGSGSTKDDDTKSSASSAPSTKSGKGHQTSPMRKTSRKPSTAHSPLGPHVRKKRHAIHVNMLPVEESKTKGEAMLEVKEEVPSEDKSKEETRQEVKELPKVVAKEKAKEQKEPKKSEEVSVPKPTAVIHSASGLPPGQFASGIPPPPPDSLDTRLDSRRNSKKEESGPSLTITTTPQKEVVALEPVATEDSPPSPDEPAKTFYRRLSKGSLSPAKLAEAVKLDEAKKELEKKEKKEKAPVALNNWMVMDETPYFFTVTPSYELMWSTSESGPSTGSIPLLDYTLEIDEVEITFMPDNDGEDITVEPSRVPEDDKEDWVEEWVEKIEEQIREGINKKKLAEAEKEA